MSTPLTSTRVASPTVTMRNAAAGGSGGRSFSSLAIVSPFLVAVAALGGHDDDAAYLQFLTVTVHELERRFSEAALEQHLSRAHRCTVAAPHRDLEEALDDLGAALAGEANHLALLDGAPTRAAA